MLVSSLFLKTLREEPKEAEIKSHKLLLRAGYIKKISSGIYTFLPLGFKVLKKIEKIVREEMDRTGAQELLLTMLIQKELWDETGRWALYGPELIRIKDRQNKEFCLGPTHEEVITHLVRTQIKSYRELPVILYQIQTKFR
jgi:prolyl-tRNA synthetase